MTTERSGGGDLRLSLELLWRGRERQARGPKPSLSLDQIVTAAIKVADAEGLGALSMRRVAAELGVGTMSLYRYVPGKGELLDLMLDKVSDPGDTAERVKGLDWRGVLNVTARGTRELYLAHPWLLQVNWARPVLGPTSLACLELVLHGLDGLDLSDQEKMMVVVAVDSFVTGTARTYVHSLAAAEGTGMSDEEFWATQGPFLEKAMSTGAYPTLASMSEDAFGASHEQTFEFGLARLLDGIEGFIARRTQYDPP
ncbi:MAG: TetR family transcriptional regulator [Streptosporangiales bacterium]|nr:TetR family transcriptional regulator [Streptosporangiales bacterium]